jgi:RimJ/RimL family protein N-acetyltransferase
VNNPFRIGTKVYLRPLEKADAKTLASWFNDQEVTRTLRIHRPISIGAEELFLERLAQEQQDIVLGIVIKATDRLIGTTGLRQIDPKNRHASFGISIGEKGEWNKGYGTEATRLLVNYAFETLNLNRVWLEVYENNERGIRAYEKVGFKKEGVLRQAYFNQGRYWNTLVMAILREEWHFGGEPKA